MSLPPERPLSTVHELRRSQRRALVAVLLIVCCATLAASAPAAAPESVAAPAPVPAGGDWHGDAPGVRHLVRASALPAGATKSSANPVSLVPRPANALPKVPADYQVTALVSGLQNPRVVRVAPNGDVFVAETSAGRVRALRVTNGQVQQIQVFATGLDEPFGIAFYPLGSAPQWLYVATQNSVLRYPYRSGDLQARGAAEKLVAELAPHTGGHTTRDLVFTRDGKRLLVSVGSGSNVAQEGGLPKRSDAELRDLEAHAGLGAAWGSEERRADVLAFDPEGHREARAFATGIRNCAGLAVHPDTGDVWCATNERDGLGDDLVPDYITRVREGAFYGWPWYYLGDHADPRWPNARPDLRGHITMPDVLLQAHSAALGVAFWRGAAYVTLHGSWNRSVRTGYKVVRIPLENGAAVADAGYEDFMTGFVLDERQAWGRPVGVAVAADGALLVTDDGSGTLWRVTAPSP
jgi:hypothetical protein